jgi:hypothetical protein
MNFKLLALTLIVFTMPSTSLVGHAMDDGTDSKALGELNLKIDQVLRRLESIESRLSAIEDGRINRTQASRARNFGMPVPSPYVRWWRPNSSSVDPSVDSGMLLDGAQRNMQRKKETSFKLVPNEFVPNETLIEIVPLETKR